MFAKDLPEKNVTLWPSSQATLVWQQETDVFKYVKIAKSPTTAYTV